MNISFFKIFVIFGIVSNWAAKALADGKVTLQEAVDLTKALAKELDVKTELDVSTLLTTDKWVDLNKEEALDEQPAPPPKIVPQE